jgi:multidrug resistance efflux pump
MRRLKARPSLHTLPHQPRSKRQAVIRLVYFSALLGLAAWLSDLFLGSLFYLRSEGLVLGEPAVIAAEFPVTVRDLLVREGEHVKAGSVAAIVTSQTVAESIARLTADLAGRESRLSELRIRGEKVEALIRLAQMRQEVTADARSELEKLMKDGLLTLDKRTAAVESEFRSLQDLEALKAEKRVVEAEINNLQTASLEAETAVRDLRHLYDDGKMRVPIDGIVSHRAVDKGAVVRAGEPLIEISGEQRFVLAYIPPGGLYDVAVGDRVQINSGLRSAEGIITRVEPFAAALPREFQRAFTPVERQQVLRVEFAPGENAPPLFTKVQLRSYDRLPRFITRLWARAPSLTAEFMNPTRALP